MDVVLLRDVERVGAQGTIIQVKAGFARNYLFPRGLATPASARQLTVMAEATRQQEQKAQRHVKQAETLKRKLERHSLTLKLSLGEGDKPFGSVTSHEIADALQRDGFPVERHALQLEQPIKTLGIFDLPVRLHPQVTATVKVWVVKA